MDFMHEKLLRVYARDENICQNCGKLVPTGQGQVAHLIGQGKRNKKKYGEGIVHHICNTKLSCSNYCNSRLDISNDMTKVEEVLIDIIKYELEK